eukprot:1162090-Pelagomonas_calceolata.AAC.12
MPASGMLVVTNKRRFVIPLDPVKLLMEWAQAAGIQQSSTLAVNQAQSMCTKLQAPHPPPCGCHDGKPQWGAPHDEFVTSMLMLH